ncbi:hypothetical protein [Streptomyces sp. NPDC002490]|uniref:hypothetical protein n=1 Tax=Streptomyces sp. NPDC002490 TaxID=3154416 RepID=UPI00332B4103
MHSFAAANAPEGDDWETWLGHADLLTAAGDPRGEALRQEHRVEVEGGDPDRVAAAYREVERHFGLDGLREDGSWHFAWARGFLDEARFRLAAETRPQRGALVQRLLAELPHTVAVDPADPEQWEGALIDAVLSHPAAGRLRTLELRLTDHHHAAEQAAASLASRSRPRLERLAFGYGYAHLYEPSRTSTGGRIEPLDHHDEGFVQTDVWGALPGLRTLDLEGPFLFHSVDHERLTRLRARGPVISDGSTFGLGDLPGLLSLEVSMEGDVFGVCCPVEQLDELTVESLPGLRQLDLSGADFDASPFDVLCALADSPVLPQLTELAIRHLVVEEEECEGAPLDALTALAPKFAHLDLHVTGDLDVPGASDEEVARVLGLEL